MSKYYVVNGDFKFVTNAENHWEAAYKAFLKAKANEVTLGRYFYISQAGFRGPKDYERQNTITTDEVPDEQIDIKDIED